MRGRDFVRKAWRRIQGLPRTRKELDRSLRLLAELRSMGWHASARRNRSVDLAGRALPWFVYPAISWLEPRLRPSDRVFEFGSGQSTLWFAARVREVVSVEHDIDWMRALEPRLPLNATVVFRDVRQARGGTSEGTEEYVSAIEEYGSRYFDVVVVDGLERSACARRAVPHLSEDGLIIFDNADRRRYWEGLLHLGEAGFERVDFAGFVPGYSHLASTSVFFRGGGRWTSPRIPPRDLGG